MRQGGGLRQRAVESLSLKDGTESLERPRWLGKGESCTQREFLRSAGEFLKSKGEGSELWTENIFEEIMAKNFPNLMKTINV